MIVLGFAGLVGVMGFVAWVVFHDPWVRSHGDPAGSNAAHHVEQVQRRRRLVTRQALDRLSAARDRCDAVERSDYLREASAQRAGCVVTPSLNSFSPLQRS